ncbi:hypothetical protein [Rhodococcus opacus]|uniref:hypothetical protein n=1 Tax=Rhodococcus opacus TaxID=37919 RepID=UPI00131FD53A|nr:hypothetical protein [Rhodococcus opacus]QHE74374.1 hypothetical protein GFS60_08076 [Rhodococcus sp. WAY2]
MSTRWSAPNGSRDPVVSLVLEFEDGVVTNLSVEEARQLATELLRCADVIDP